MQMIALPKNGKAILIGGLLKYNFFVLFSGSCKIIFLVSGFNGNCTHSHLFSCPTPILISQQLYPPTEVGTCGGQPGGGGGGWLCRLLPLPWRVPPRSCILPSLFWNTGERSLKSPSTPEAPGLCFAPLSM